MERIVLSQEEYMRRQIEEMFGEKNMYYVREKIIGREPTKEEVEWWYIEHGGPEDFAKRYVQEKVVEAEHEKEKNEKKENTSS